MFTIIGTDTYLAEIAKWPKDIRAMADELPGKLKQNPKLGDVAGYRFLREKRVDGRRIYYLIYEDLEIILIVAVSGKKDQQKTIDHIKWKLDEFRILAEKIAKQAS